MKKATPNYLKACFNTLQNHYTIRKHFSTMSISHVNFRILLFLLIPAFQYSQPCTVPASPISMMLTENAWHTTNEEFYGQTFMACKDGFITQIAFELNNSNNTVAQNATLFIENGIADGYNDPGSGDANADYSQIISLPEGSPPPNLETIVLTTPFPVISGQKYTWYLQREKTLMSDEYLIIEGQITDNPYTDGFAVYSLSTETNNEWKPGGSDFDFVFEVTIEPCFDLFVKDDDDNVIPNYSGLNFIKLPEPEETKTFKNDFGCTILGAPVNRTFYLLNCEAMSIPPPLGIGDGLSEVDLLKSAFPANITCPEGMPENGSSSCYLTIEGFHIVSPTMDDVLPNPDAFPPNTTDFTLLSPAFPLNVTAYQSVPVEVEFDPQTIGEHEAWVYICYENTCPCPILPPGIHSNLLKNNQGFPCNTTYVYSFPIFGCAVRGDLNDLSNEDPDISDPCSCEDPENTRNETTFAIILFHDVIRLESGVSGQDWQIVSSVNPLWADAAGTIPALNISFSEVDPGIYELEVWHPPLATTDIMLSLNFGEDIIPFFAEACVDNCRRIPTIGQWGLIVLSFLLLIFGSVVIQHRSVIQNN